MEIKNPRIPLGFQELDYIENTSTSYIDTGYKPNHKTTLAIKYIQYDNGIPYQSIYGARDGSALNDFQIFKYANVSYATVRYGTSSDIYYATIPNYSLGVEHLLELTADKLRFDNQEFAISPYPDFASSMGLALFGVNDMNNSSPIQCSIGKIYYCKIWDNGILVRDYIPCYRKVDGMVGMYDLVNGLFHNSPNGNNFARGNDVVTTNAISIPEGDVKIIETTNGVLWKKPLHGILPNIYQQVEYIEAGQGQYIDTQFNVDFDSTLDIYSKNNIANDGTRACICSNYKLYNPIGMGTFSMEYINGLRTYYVNPDYAVIAPQVFGVANQNEVHWNKTTSTIYSVSGGIRSEDYSISYLQSKNISNCYLFVDGAKRFSTFNRTHKMYFFRLVKDGVTILNAIPCYRKSDNEVGMFDLINDVFYINMGTGTFGKGADV